MTTETQARRRWTALILSFFAAQVVLWTYAITTVSTDPSHAVVADYDAKALDWDAQRERQAASAALGWTADVELDPLGGVHLVLSDRDRKAVAGADVEVTLFHHAEASKRQRITLTADGAGGYRGAAQLHRPGRWTVAVMATRGAEAYVTSVVTRM